MTSLDFCRFLWPGWTSSLGSGKFVVFVLDQRGITSESSVEHHAESVVVKSSKWVKRHERDFSSFRYLSLTCFRLSGYLMD